MTVAGHNVQITGTITLPVSATNPVTASIANFPVTQSVWFAPTLGLTASVVFPAGFTSNITQSITLPVSATNPITASVSNWPTTFPGNVNITGSTVYLSSSVVGASSASFLLVTASGSATLLKAVTAGRKGITFYNSGTTAAYVLLDNGSWATANRFTCVVGSGGYYEAPYGWTGQVSALWVGTPGGSGTVTEVF
jgi:hypothetical protein